MCPLTYSIVQFSNVIFYEWLKLLSDNTGVYNELDDCACIVEGATYRWSTFIHVLIWDDGLKRVHQNFKTDHISSFSWKGYLILLNSH